MTLFYLVVGVPAVIGGIVFCLSFVFGSLKATYISLFAVVAAIVIGFTGYEPYLNKYGVVSEYESAVLSKDIEVYTNRGAFIGTRYGMVVIPRNVHDRYVLYCMNPYDFTGEDVKFYVDRKVYDNTDIGDKARIKVTTIGNEVVRAQLMGNNGVVGEVNK